MKQEFENRKKQLKTLIKKGDVKITYVTGHIFYTPKSTNSTDEHDTLELAKERYLKECEYFKEAKRQKHKGEIWLTKQFKGLTEEAFELLDSLESDFFDEFVQYSSIKSKSFYD